MLTASLAQGAPGPNRSAEIRGRDRRAAERLDMNLALGTFEHLGTRMPCEVIDLSLTGCCLKTREEFKAGALAHAKVTVPIDEMVQSIWELPSGEAGAHPWDQVIREMIEMDGKQSGV